MRPMPQPRKEPDNQHIPQMPGHALPVSSQRYIYIIPEPGGQGYMPAPPEIRDRHGRKRITEVFRKMKAQHPSHTNGHIAVGAEIKIQLQSKGRRPEPGRRGRNLDGRKQTDFFPHGADLIGDKRLLEKPLHEPQDSLFRLFLFYLPAVQFLIYRGKTDNRPRHQLRKHGYISKVSEIILFHRHLPSVKINAVAHRLKGKKT